MRGKTHFSGMGSPIYFPRTLMRRFSIQLNRLTVKAGIIFNAAVETGIGIQ